MSRCMRLARFILANLSMLLVSGCAATATGPADDSLESDAQPASLALFESVEEQDAASAAEAPIAPAPAPPISAAPSSPLTAPIAQATNPSEAVEAYAKALAAAPNDVSIEATYLRKMVELGLP